MFKFLLIISLSGLAINAWRIIDNYGGRIVNGYNIEIEDVPYQVGIFDKDWFSCGGSIISAKYILTAAHCFDDYKPMVHAGSSKLKQGGSYHNAIRVIIHEKYNDSTMEYDIGLIEVHPELPFDGTRKPISLLKNAAILKTGDVALVTGWGAITEDGDVSPYLQAVKVPIISRELCQQEYAPEGTIFENQICAGYPEGEKDSCQGDSGGPMVVRGQLAGIVSWGKGCARAALPGVYTSVAHYIEWIAANTGLEL